MLYRPTFASKEEAENKPGVKGDHWTSKFLCECAASQ